MLLANKYQVLVADSGEKALDTCRSTLSTIHMLLTNIVMPGIDGFALAAAIRAERPEIRAIAMSTHMDSEILNGNLPDFIITHPFHPAALLETIRSVLDTVVTATTAV